MSKLDGINVHVSVNGWTSELKSLGLKWSRIDINWNNIEPNKGSYTWSQLDKCISDCKSCGLQVYASIAYVPNWISSKYTDCPDSINWYNFIQAVVKRYGSKIDVYGLWNEPNLKQFYTGKRKDYFNKILIPGYNAIKSINQNILVAGCEFSTASGSHWTTWSNDAKKYTKYFDIFSFHTYQKSGDAIIKAWKLGKHPILGLLIPRYRSYKGYFKKLNKPIWLTEFGWETDKYGEMKVANFYRDLLSKRSKLEIDQLFAYEFKDELPQYSWGLYYSSKIQKLPAAIIRSS